MENISKIQRLNLELKGIDEESGRLREEIESLKLSIKTIEDDEDREKSVVIDANSNEKRLKEEKNELINIDSKYFENEKLSNLDLESAKDKLQSEINRIKDLIKENKNVDALKLLDDFEKIIELYTNSFSENKIFRKETIKRRQRIENISTEIESWKNLLSKSEKMINELNNRKNNFNIKLKTLENQPQSQAEKKERYQKV